MKYRKKPVEVEAIEWTGHNLNEVYEFVGYPRFEYNTGLDKLSIHTLEGTMEANTGDFIIKGVKGEFYPCKPDIFAMTYEEV